MRRPQITPSTGDPSRLSTLSDSSYPRSAAVDWHLRFVEQQLLSCATRAAVRVHSLSGGEPTSTVLERYVPLSVTVEITTLVAELPESNDAESSGVCVAVDVVLLDPFGVVVQTAPTTHPVAICPGSAGAWTFGG